MDGEVVLGALRRQVCPDCLKNILPKYGHQIKVYHAIRLAVSSAPPQSVLYQILFWFHCSVKAQKKTLPTRYSIQTIESIW